MNTLTDEQINQISEVFNQKINSFKHILDAIIDVVSEIFEWLRTIFDEDILIIRRKRKGKRMITYFIKEKLYKLILSYKDNPPYITT